MEIFPHLDVRHYHECRSDIRSGDILLCSGHSPFSTLIKKATQSVWSHVGFVLNIDAINRLMLLESVESIGVRTIPLSSYVSDYNATGRGYPGRIMLARHKQLRGSNIGKFSRSAVNFLGYPYGTDEIVRIATRISMHALGMHGLEPEHTNKREFICSEYAYACFKSIGVEIDYNPLGFITPADFATHKDVEALFYIASDNSQHAWPLEIATQERKII